MEVENSNKENQISLSKNIKSIKPIKKHHKIKLVNPFKEFDKLCNKLEIPNPFKKKEKLKYTAYDIKAEAARSCGNTIEEMNEISKNIKAPKTKEQKKAERKQHRKEFIKELPGEIAGEIVENGISGLLEFIISAIFN